VVTPAATDNWVHNAHGEPLLVVTSEINAKLTQVLEPILADVRRLVGDDRRMTVVFDRGGFSPKLFARLIDAGSDVLTYRKGKVKKLPLSRFETVKEDVDGVQREYTLCDRPRVRVGTLPAQKKQRGGLARRNCWECCTTTIPAPPKKAARCCTPPSNRPPAWKSPRMNSA